MGLKITHFPTVKTLDDFDFKFQPSVDQRLVRELATARFLAQAENVLIFGAPAWAKRISRTDSDADRHDFPADSHGFPPFLPLQRARAGADWRLFAP